MKNRIAQPIIPQDYGHRRNYAKIDLYYMGEYRASTTWARSQLIARVAYAEKYHVNLCNVRAIKGK